MKGGRGEYLVPVTIPSTYVIFPKIRSSKHSFFFFFFCFTNTETEAERTFCNHPQGKQPVRSRAGLGPALKHKCSVPQFLG